MLCQMRSINSTSRGNALAPNRRNSLPGTGLTDKGRDIKGLVVSYVACLISMTEMGLVPYCGQDGYRAQVPQHPAHTYKQLQYIFDYWKNDFQNVRALY